MAKRLLPPNEIIVSLYRSGKSTGEIAEQFQVHPSAVINLLRRIGEPRRSNKEAMIIRGTSGRHVVNRAWLGRKQPAEMVERRLSQIRGEKHYLWKGGDSRRQYRRKVLKEFCVRCKTRQNLGIHHADFDHYNDAVENLQVLCVSCHMSVHKQAWWDAKKVGTPYFSNAPSGRGRGYASLGGTVHDL